MEPITDKQERLIIAAAGVMVGIYRRARNTPDAARVKVMDAVKKALSRTADGEEVEDEPAGPSGAGELEGVIIEGVALFREMFDDFGIDRSDQIQQESVYRTVERAVDRKLAEWDGRKSKSKR